MYNKIKNKIYYIKKQYQFLYIKKHGIKIRSPYIIIFANISNTKHMGIGLDVTKHIGKAHIRNLIKRRLKNILCVNNNYHIYHEINIIIHPIHNLTTIKYHKLKFELYNAIKTATTKLKYQ